MTAAIRVQACGDAHLMDFGGFATPERKVIFDVNDLDETLPAPFEWDLKRLAASVVIAAQHLELPGDVAERVTLAVVQEYRGACVVTAPCVRSRSGTTRSTCNTSTIVPAMRSAWHGCGPHPQS